MQKYKVLLLTPFSEPWDNGWYYKTGLEKNGQSVIPLDPVSVDNSLSKIKKIIKEQKPDFILHTKDEVPAEAFHELRQHTKVIMWYPDPVIPEWLPAYVKASDVFLTMSEGLTGAFQKYNPNVFWLTQAFEPSFFKIKDITKEDEKTFSTEVTFVGNLGSKDQYLNRRKFLDRVIKEDFKFKWWGPRLPRKFSTLPLIAGRLGRSYGGRFVWGEEYAKTARLSKVFLAFDSMPHIRKSMSARMYTAVGCGAFYMCQYVDGIEDVLEPGKEIVTFRTGDEMISKIRYYLENDEARMKIAEAGEKRILKEHTYETRIRELIGILEKVI